MSYDLRDFLMFTPEVYLRLFVRLNDILGPWLVLVVIGLLSIPVLLCLRTVWASRLAMTIAAVGWVLAAALFMHRLYGPINLPVSYFVWAFALEAVLLVIAAVRASALAAGAFGAVSMLAAILVLSIASAWAAGQWQAVTLPGLTPDMTATATTVLLAGMPRCWWRVGLLVVPVLWCLFSVLTHWALGLMLPMIVPVAGIAMAVALVLWPGPKT